MHLRHLPTTLLVCRGLTLLDTSCQNDAYIGDFYGQWQLTELSTADTVAYPRNLFFAFQSNVIQAIITGTDAHFSSTIKGTWEQKGDSLFISFYSEPELLDANRQYLKVFFVMDGEPNDLRFGLQLSSQTLTLTQGNSSQWHFRKY